ncbi:MAG TPA: hypothetical protein VND19_25070 [Acetobacteraceae bacterium]|nr:hypothetical protein [Acetobacteraceae bacterium]
MQKPSPGPVWRILGWVLVPLYYPEYRRLLIRSYVLSARLELLCALFAVTAPFATLGWLRLIRRWLGRLREDVAEFGRLVRMPRAPVAMRRARIAPQAGNDSGFQNPWT